ncbi:MAG TPA: 4a-hydroxytetrahydrobiopterin dehydratase [bacterium]|jgi:4a-hydroxytetrahydrobiopterin dehydratase|nr:4a-hydroxytetrahydrobiopterin dehydratase [bacterium]
MWEEKNNSLVREFIFKDFKEAFAFMITVAKIIDEMDHHPEWSNVYNKVKITLSTHEAGNTVTQKDRDLADKIDEVYAPLNI